MPSTNSESTATPNLSRPSWWQNEDWLAVIAAAALIVTVVGGWRPKMPTLAWKSAADLETVFSAANLAGVLTISLPLIALSALLLIPQLGKRVVGYVAGGGVVFALAWLAQWLAANGAIKAYGLEYVIFALALGLLWSHLLPQPGWLRNAVRTEFFIKIGIVILGAGMLFGDLLKAGMPGMVQALLVIPVVWQITFRLARWLKVDDEFGVMLSTAVSICGVSAAIASCGAIQGDKKKLSYVTSVVLLCAVPMMILMPWCSRWMGLSEAVGGAWLGGTLDTSGSVLAATELLGETATKVGTVVKLSQNVLIGVAAFFISIWWTFRERRADGGSRRPGLGVIWERFPKFVLGFVGASLVFSFLLSPDVVKACDKPLKGLREVWFSAAFVCIGLDTRLGDLARLDGIRPLLAFLGGQAANIVWTLLLAWLLFGARG
ncbi:MAG: putative sulfate exporter family transporter [Verrucomicrobiae bacterium]|nr:putative sulfate exporter family transporter [Verrucomicrobiae bacterium]